MKNLLNKAKPYILGAVIALVLLGGTVAVGKIHYYLRVVFKMEEILKNSKVAF